MALLSTIGGGGTLFVGEDKTLRFELIDASSLPVDMTGMTMVFDVRAMDTSSVAIVSKTPSLVGAFSSIRASNTQRAVVSLTDTELNLFKAKTYRWSWKQMDAGLETVFGWGDFKPQKATAP